MYKEHPEFCRSTIRSDAMLWRYMDFTKFVSLLDTASALFFARADKLGRSF